MLLPLGWTMHARRGYKVWLHALLQPGSLFALAMIAAIWIGMALMTSIERDKLLEGAIQQSDNLVSLFEENTVQTFERFDRTLILLRKSIEDDPEHFNLRDWADRAALVRDLTIQLSLVGADGYLIATTGNDSGPPLYLGDREHIRVQVDGVDKLFISPPVVGRASGKWTIQFTRPVRTRDGGFGGVLVISVDPNFIDTFYKAINLGAHGSLTIRNLDNVILARRGVEGDTPGRKAASPAFRDALAKGPVGHYWGNGSPDGVNRLVAYRVSERFPLIFTVGRAETEIFQSARRNMIVYTALAAAMTFLVMLAAALGMRHQLRLDRVRDNLRRSEGQAQERARELEAKSREIVHLAHHDPLTGLANRLLLQDRIERAFARSRRHQERFAILCIDLDRFKIANDTLGHQAGDALLREVAERLRRCSRDVDTIARVGGDEFVVLAQSPHVTELAKRILEGLGAPYDVGGNPVVMTASIGIAVAPSDGASIDRILGNADLALYRAKANGRNDFCYFDSQMEQVALKRGRLESELRDALARDEFELWYQPWFNIRSGRIVGCEALVRWRHPQRGLLAPTEFLSIAEETGLIGQLGNWVLRRGCHDAARWPSGVRLAINLSAAQFIGGALFGTVMEALAESGLAVKRLELEITETLIIDDFEGTREALDQLRSQGINIALDDFGTGYSSLTHLRQLLFDRIKIDKSFVAELTTRAESATIVSAVIALGDNLGVGVTAEGVETQDQLDILRAAGCVEVQGYYLSRPIPLANLLERLSVSEPKIVAA
jgi:diguanylate cyclase (GGDEF)-like protein